jgi:hypothetical protein
MSNRTVNPAAAEPAVGEMFYELAGCVPLSEAAWAERQVTLHNWRQDARFEPYWPSIEQMLSDDLASLQRRNAAMTQATAAAHDLAGYDFDALRQQREYDLKHAHDHLP